jgi:hypothetical protein
MQRADSARIRDQISAAMDMKVRDGVPEPFVVRCIL